MFILYEINYDISNKFDILTDDPAGEGRNDFDIAFIAFLSI